MFNEHPKREGSYIIDEYLFENEADRFTDELNYETGEEAVKDSIYDLFYWEKKTWICFYLEDFLNLIF